MDSSKEPSLKNIENFGTSKKTYLANSILHKFTACTFTKICFHHHFSGLELTKGFIHCRPMKEARLLSAESVGKHMGRSKNLKFSKS